LLELGRVSELRGVDSDARKIEAARTAAPEARFSVGDVARLALARHDTILLIDVLHYLPLP
jgi:trans-aconitate methyltransferase